MVVKKLIGSIYRFTRQIFYRIFRKKYLAKQIAARKGECKNCGCCGDMPIKCKYWTGKDCFIWRLWGYDDLPYQCKISPFDEKDKNEHQKKHCAFYWEK